MGISEYHGSKNDPINARLDIASIQHFELGLYFFEKRIIRLGVRTYDFERTIGCEVHDHLFSGGFKTPVDDPTDIYSRVGCSWNKAVLDS